MATVVYDNAKFVTRYPEFSALSGDTLAAYFDEATLYLNPTDACVVADEFSRGLLLNMLTAHIAYLANPERELVGRISNASEGSVSVAADMGATPGTAAWYQQSKYGASYWASTAKYRRFRYVQGYSRPQVYMP